MAYKDKDRQREAGKERQRRYRAKLKGVTHKPKRNAQDVTPATKGQTPGITICPGITIIDEPPSVIPERTRIALERGPARQPLTKEQQVSKRRFND